MWRRLLIKLPVAAFAAVALAHAFGFVGRGADAMIWDDALFFRRVAYNIVHHGFAGWNQQDGPVFVSTSQLHQLVGVALSLVARNHFVIAVIAWSALCVSMCLVLLSRLYAACALGAVAFLFVAMQAPPVLTAIGTGMETCTVFVVLGAFLVVLRKRPTPMALAAMNALVYLARPDAVILSGLASLGVLAGDRPRLFRFCGLTALALGAILLVCFLYYGTPLPLAAFLKLTPWSHYDAAYIALDHAGKLQNLTAVVLTSLPLVSLAVMRRDRENLSLVGAGAIFAVFHAATTSEIMGYHARFYAPAFVFLAAAAVRALTRESARVLLVGALASAALAWIAYDRAWIENATSGFALNRVPAGIYGAYFVGLVVVGGAVAAGQRPIAHLALVLSAAAFAVWRDAPRSPSLASDAQIYARVIGEDSSLVGLDVVTRCFPEPIALAHSEIGIPGVVLPESRIIDFSGLANRDVIRGGFDFDALCRDRPEVIFRPHWTHQRLNEGLARHACLASSYVTVPLPKPSSCPLLVRSDLLERFERCRRE